MSSFAKVFSLVLRNRLNNWCEDKNKLNEFQFGFRDGCSTVDCIFILHAIITKVLREKQKLFCAFIDFRKAFDTISHTFLWAKLLHCGVGNRFVNMLKSMYAQVRNCVRLFSNVSEFCVCIYRS